MTETPPFRPISPFSSTVKDLVRRPAVTITTEDSITKAAKRMEEEGVGSLVVVDKAEQPVGMLTNTDMVRRVIAAQADCNAAVKTVMSDGVYAIAHERPLIDALLLMIQKGIGHLVVEHQGVIMGVISDRDWVNFQQRHPAASFRNIEKADSTVELRELRERANTLVRQFFGEEGTAESLTQLVTEINDRVAKRAINIVLQQHGTPPVEFSWIALGSEGREEQTLATDQDNGLVFRDPPSGKLEETRAWFLTFAQDAVKALEECGFPLCKGNTMASNPELCLSQSEWRSLFASLIARSEPQDLLKASIYFDFRPLLGDASLVEAMWEELLSQVGRNRHFLRFMGGSAEFFGRVPVHTFGWKLRDFFGINQQPIDIKKQAIGPLVRCARALALGSGISTTHTMRRLEAVQKAGVLPDGLASSVRSAYDFLMLLRIRHHFRQQSASQAPDNNISFHDLNPLEGRFLAEALKTVGDLEGFTLQHFGGIDM